MSFATFDINTLDRVRVYKIKGLSFNSYYYPEEKKLLNRSVILCKEYPQPADTLFKQYRMGDLLFERAFFKSFWKGSYAPMTFAGVELEELLKKEYTKSDAILLYDAKELNYV